MTIEINNESDIDLDTEPVLRLVKHIMAQLHLNPRTQVALLLVNETAMSKLNEQWLGHSGATDVLSFPMDELRPGRPDAIAPEGILGDIVLCPQVAAVQADNAGHSLAEEITVLVTHGMLHLLGYDHATPVEEAEMFALQRELIISFAQAN